MKKKTSKTPIVILHGWKKQGADYKQIKTIFEKKGYIVYAPDMPGFGKEKLNKSPMTVNDYVLFIKKFFRENGISEAILIGHSFGGRVAAKFTAQYPSLVSSLILTGAPLIKQPLSWKKRIILFPSRIGKNLVTKIPAVGEQARKLVYRALGEWDYYKAGDLRETFKYIVAEDLVSYLPQIQVPTLVVWGENDTFVSSKVGRKIAATVPQGTYVEVPGATHKLPYENPSLFAQAVLQFIQ